MENKKAEDTEKIYTFLHQKVHYFSVVAPILIKPPEPTHITEKGIRFLGTILDPLTVLTRSSTLRAVNFPTRQAMLS